MEKTDQLIIGAPKNRTTADGRKHNTVYLSKNESLVLSDTSPLWTDDSNEWDIIAGINSPETTAISNRLQLFIGRMLNTQEINQHIFLALGDIKKHLIHTSLLFDAHILRVICDSTGFKLHYKHGSPIRKSALYCQKTELLMKPLDKNEINGHFEISKKENESLKIHSNSRLGLLITTVS